MDKNDSSWIFFPLFFLSVNVQWLCRCRCHSCPGQGRPTLGWLRSSWRSGSWDLCWPSPLSDPLPNSTASKGRSWTAPSHVRHRFNYSVLHVYDSAVDQFYWDRIDTKCRGVINVDVYYGCTSRAVLFFSFFSWIFCDFLDIFLCLDDLDDDGRHTTYGKVHSVFNLLHLYFMSPRTSKRTCHCSQAGVFQLYSSSVFSQISFEMFYARI